MAVKLAHNGIPQFFDDNGDPLSGGLLFTYVAGSSTKQATYQDDAGGVQHANPIVLNSRGEPPAPIWLTVGVTYKFVLAPATDSDPPAAPIWTADDIAGINDASVAIDQWVTGPAPTFVSTTSFTLVGDQTTEFHAGRRLKTTNSGGTVYSTILSSAFGVLTTVTVLNDSGVLDSGLSAVSYGLVSKNNTSAPDQKRIEQNSQSTAYTTVASDAGKHILHPAADNNARTFTIDSNANVPYPIGTAITFVNEINTLTIAITSDTLVLAGAGTTGSRTLGAMGIATALKKTSTSWIISGSGLT